MAGACRRNSINPTLLSDSTSLKAKALPTPDQFRKKKKKGLLVCALHSDDKKIDFKPSPLNASTSFVKVQHKVSLVGYKRIILSLR